MLLTWWQKTWHSPMAMPAPRTTPWTWAVMS